MNRKYEVRLTTADHTHIQEKLNDAKTSAGIRKRCMILLMVDEQAGTIPTQAEIAQRCNASDVTVYQTIKAYCLFGIEHTLQYRKRAEPPRRRLITGETEARIIALACSEPPKGVTRWTIRLVAKRAVELEILETIGRETIRTT